MNYILIMLVAVFISAQNVLQKKYNTKTSSPNAYLFTAISAFSAMIFFVTAAGFKMEFNTELLPYSFAFGMAFAICFTAVVYAMKYGMMSLTSLITAYSLIIPTFYGIIFLNEEIKYTVYVGIILLLVSLLLLNIKSGQGGGFSLKWLIFVTLAFLGNGMCSVVQNMQQNKFDGKYKSEFMIIALAIVVVSMLICAFRQKNVKTEFLGCAKSAVFAGVSNGIVNLLVMILVTSDIPGAIFYPSISAGGIVLSFIFAICVYKEKLTKRQFTGYLIGIFSVVILNL